MEEKRLTKVREGKIICGVCTGIGKYFGIDPTLVRLVFAGLCLFGFSGVIAYIAAVFIMPQEDPREN